MLCKAFLAPKAFGAAVCLDSAARRCGWLLRFCVRKTVPCFGHENETIKSVNNYYEKALASTENILTAAAFRPRLLLGSGFGKFKAGALSFHAKHKWLTTQQTAVAVEGVGRLIASFLCVGRPRSCVFARSITIDKPSPFPLAFRVVFLASSDGRVKLSCDVMLTGARGRVRLLLRSSAARRTAIARPSNGPRSIAFPFSRRSRAGLVGGFFAVSIALSCGGPGCFPRAVGCFIQRGFDAHARPQRRMVATRWGSTNKRRARFSRVP